MKNSITIAGARYRPGTYFFDKAPQTSSHAPFKKINRIIRLIKTSRTGNPFEKRTKIEKPKNITSKTIRKLRDILKNGNTSQNLVYNFSIE